MEFKANPKLDAALAALESDMIETLQRWIRVPSVRAERSADNAPFGAEVRRALDVAMEDISRLGMNVRDVDGYCCDCEIGEGEDVVAVLAHLDVVPEGDGWDHDPYGGEIVDGRMVVVLASDVLFASGSANLSRDGKSAIGEVAALLADIPDRKFQIEGHTDNVPIRTAVYPSNWELASARALTVLKTMLEAGMPADRISAASFGDSKPARDNETPEGKAANRRIEIVVTPDLSTLPGLEELNRVATDAS